jgi:hypothetical protein
MLGISRLCAQVAAVGLSYYDGCSAEPTFPALAKCMKEQRNTACHAANTCSANGDAAVAYADALAPQVQNREIREGTARTKFTEYRIKALQEQQHDAAAIAAGAAAGAAAAGPTTCIKSGNTTNCF